MFDLIHERRVPVDEHENCGTMQQRELIRYQYFHTTFFCLWGIQHFQDHNDSQKGHSLNSTDKGEKIKEKIRSHTEMQIGRDAFHPGSESPFKEARKQWHEFNCLTWFYSWGNKAGFFHHTRQKSLLLFIYNLSTSLSEFHLSCSVFLRFLLPSSLPFISLTEI